MTTSIVQKSVFCCITVSLISFLSVRNVRSEQIQSSLLRKRHNETAGAHGADRPLSFSDRILSEAQHSFRILDTRPSRDCRTKYGRDVRMYYCPTPAPKNPLDWTCVRELQLCNGIPDCPIGEDEDPTMCMFHLAYRDELKRLKELIIDVMLSAPGQTVDDSQIIRPESETFDNRRK